MSFLLQRLTRLAEELGRLRYTQTLPVTGVHIWKGPGTPDPACAGAAGWEPWRSCDEIDTSGSESGARGWFSFRFAIPPQLDGQCVRLEVITATEGWDADNPQFIAYVNGVLRQGFDINHTGLVLDKKAREGDEYTVVLSMLLGHGNSFEQLKVWLRAVDTDTEALYYDMLVPLQAAKLLDGDSADYLAIIDAVNRAANLLDLRLPHSGAYSASLKAAAAELDKTLYARRFGHEATVWCVGHTHIDVAWLWTLAATEDKSVRSFASVLALMERYPEYVFMSSQPQLYQYVKNNAPQVYEGIKKRVAEGRWEPEGGMFVEADTNLAGGEALVRQVLYGTRFFKREFGKDNRVLWLPDVFGYCAALPQIMKKSGLDYFMTTKISWNETNTLPYDTFMWEGIDGTRVLTHFICSREWDIWKALGSANAPHITTYNADLTPGQVKGAWQRYQQKNLGSDILMSYGYGDGGGGPTEEMLEKQRRIQKGIPGLPLTKTATSRQFFEALEKQVAGDRRLPVWVGELYLEFHRGTYTSMARNKRYNRKSEIALQNAELYGVLGRLLAGAAYPREALYANWEVLMRNQFHDILPGSSIKAVYEDSRQEYEGLLAQVGEVTGGLLQNLAAAVDAPEGSVVVFNPTGFARTGPVRLPGLAGRAVTNAGAPLPVQGDWFLAEDVPPMGYKAFAVGAGAGAPAPAERADPLVLENGLIRLEMDKKGRFTSLTDIQGREYLKAPGNVIMTYEDKPHNYDAWDINDYYTEKSWEMDDVTAIEEAESGPLFRSVKISRRYLNSAFTQTVTVYAGQPYIDIVHEVDWRETQVLVKALFPLNVHTNEASFDIQYGNVTRPTHRNTSWDQARFEVCHHKWADLSEDGYGLSIANDCKYGCHVLGSEIGITLLKSAAYPNPDADRERHSFTLRLYPHAGGWRAAKTPQAAYALNNPLVAVAKTTAGGTQPARYSLAGCSAENVMIETVKLAEDSSDVIVRLYECYNRHTAATLTLGQCPARVIECDLLEREEGDALPLEDSAVTVELKPYEIKTLKLSI